jgi:repressor LexA
MIGENIKLLRTQNKMSQKQLGEKLGITQQAIGKWESNKSEPDNAMIVSIAKLFNVSTDFILHGADKQQSSVSEPKLILLARHLDELPKEDRDFLIKNFEETIDMFMKKTNLK